MARTIVLGTISCILVGFCAVCVQAETIDFEAFVIRGATAQITENPAEDGASFYTPSAGDKAGYGTAHFDGQTVSVIDNINWHVVADAGLNMPYINLWLTDDGTNFGVFAPQRPDLPEGGLDIRGQTWSGLNVKIYEYGSLGWVAPGQTVTRDGAQYLCIDGSRATMGDISGLTITDPGSPYPLYVGTGAPKNETGLNIIYGDTQTNFLGAYQIDELTVNGIPAANPIPEPATLLLVGGTLLGGLSLRRRRRRRA